MIKVPRELKNMNTEGIINYFSKMDWLKEELSRYQKSEGKNERSDKYYSTLKTIKSKQDRNQIPTDEEYISLGKIRKNRAFLHTVEYGYYTANIHYDLFRCDPSEKDQLEERILYFIDHADKNDDEMTEEYGWFLLNFPSDFLWYLMHVYKKDESDLDKLSFDINTKNQMTFESDEISENLNSLNIFVGKFGNSKEKLIVKKLINLLCCCD